MAMMDKNNKNRNAIKILIKEMTSDRSFRYEDIRLHCRAIVYTCFLMEIEPYRLPVSDFCRGDLSACQKRHFWRQYLSLLLDHNGKQYREITSMLDKAPAWSYLLDLTDKIIDQSGDTLSGNSDF